MGRDTDQSDRPPSPFCLSLSHAHVFYTDSDNAINFILSLSYAHASHTCIDTNCLAPVLYLSSNFFPSFSSLSQSHPYTAQSLISRSHAILVL